MNDNQNIRDLDFLVRLVYDTSDKPENEAILQEVEKDEKDEEGADLLAGIRQMKADFGFNSSEEHLEWLNRKKEAFSQQKWVEADIFGEKEPKGIIRNFRLQDIGIAAAAVIALLILVYFFSSKNSLEQELYKEYLADAGRNPFEQNVRNENPDQSFTPLTLYDSLSTWYQEKQFSKGIDYLEPLIDKKGPASDLLIHYLAFFHLEAGNKTESLALFQQLAENPDTPYTYEPWLTWGLAYLKFRDSVGAKTIFERAINQSDQIAPKELGTIRDVLNKLEGSE